MVVVTDRRAIGIIGRGARLWVRLRRRIWLRIRLTHVIGPVIATALMTNATRVTNAVVVATTLMATTVVLRFAGF
jgi:hypothetical protein